MAEAWERLKHPPRGRPRKPSASPFQGRTVGELEELFRKEVRELSDGELDDLFGYLAPQVKQLNITVGRAISWARAQV